MANLKPHYVYRGFRRRYLPKTASTTTANVTIPVYPSERSNGATLALLSPLAGGIFYCCPSERRV